MTWQELEKKVKLIASYLWDCPANSETIAGIKCDCVLKIKSDQYVFIEISEENDLTKLRTDIAKFSTIRNAMYLENIYPILYFVTDKNVTDSLRESGKKQGVTVCNIEEFENQFFNYSAYIYSRSQKSFGSLIDITTGQPEESSYIGVTYYSEKEHKNITINEIVKKLKDGRKIILLGGFGTGKSCCTKQIFNILTSNTNEFLYTICINLREHWGAQYSEEIIERHMRNLGFDPIQFQKIAYKHNIIYLLDGFDEIGGQAWSSDNKKMLDIRRRTVIAIKDLIEKATGGILITGREHFFNSTAEMLNCFGLGKNDVEIIRCNEEFTTEEITQYLTEVAHYNKKVENNILQWLPRRPLIIQLVAKELSEMFSDDLDLSNEYEVWKMFFDNLCKREAKINTLLDAETIKSVMIEVARCTRTKNDQLGPLTSQDLSYAFEVATGKRPTDETSIMLERLPGIGRVDADSPDRKFVDSYILDGLRVEDLIRLATNSNRPVFQEKWISELKFAGANLLSQHVRIFDQFKEFNSYAIQATRSGCNHILVSDIVSALLLADQKSKINLDQIELCDTTIDKLIFRDKKLSNINIHDCFINELDITLCQFDENCSISNCIITKVIGVSTPSGLPKQFRNNDIELCLNINTNVKVKALKLSPAQEILITILRKIFTNITKGNGRKEEALLRGLAEKDKRIRDKVLNKLINENILIKHPGDEGAIYSPNRKETSRAKRILEELTLSDDPLWLYVSEL